MERKIIDAPRLRLKADDGATADGGDGAGIITGYGSTFGNVDSMKERVIPGAFKDTIPDFLRDGFIALGHDWSGLPIATPVSAQEDDTGLLFTAEFHTTDEAQKVRQVVRERLAREKSVKLSIGYEVIEDRKGKDDVRELVKLRLFEVSVVTVPANSLADVTDAKSGLLGMPRAFAGLTHDDERATLLAGLEAWVKRLDGLQTLRAKESRTLSAQSVRDIDAAIEHAASITKGLRALKERAAPRAEDDKALAREFVRLRLKREASRELTA